MTPLIGAVQGTIVIDQYDLEKAQLDDRALNLVRSWFDRIQIRLMKKKITKELETLQHAMCYSCIK